MNNNNMTANELRIGNIVDLGNRIAKIIDISHLSCTVADLEETQDTIEDYGRVQGLILTDEWFEKWGFYKDGEYWSMGIFDYKYCFKYRDWANNWAFYQEYTDSPDSKDDGKKYPISFDIQYVHQLQNIWFALLHEEIAQ
jgi:hypothetical protein